MQIFRKRLRRFGTPCLVFSLSAALFAGHLKTLALAPAQTISSGRELKPPVAEEYQKLWAEFVKNAKVETGPKLRNPAISNDGLAPGVVSALRQQRDYLASQETVPPTQAPVNAANRELIGGTSRRPRSSAADPPCREPIIRSVNGKINGVVFTPMPADNIYRIEGCFFGDAPGIVQLEVHSAPHQPSPIPPIAMQLDAASPQAWSERELTVRLDPELSGIPDYPVTLVIYPAKHRRIELRGCRFLAARGRPQLLSMIPSTWVRLYPSGVGSRSIRQLEYVSPTEASGAAPKDAGAASAFVVRSDPGRFGIGRDSYDFSQLNPGWVVESVQLQTYSVSCPQAAPSAQSLGGWEAEWTSLGVRVAFEESVCAPLPPRFAFNMSQSQYAIRVWVIGPIGTLPLPSAR